MNLLFTANSAWNLAHFRKPLIEAFVSDGHAVEAVSPGGEGVADLAALGAAHREIAIDSKGVSPLRDAMLVGAYRRLFREARPDLVLGYTIKPNIYGGLAARSLGLPFLPNVSGLGTAFLSTTALEKVVSALYRTAFRGLPHVIFQNPSDRDLFLDRRIIRQGQAVLVPGSGVDLVHFAPRPLPAQASEGVVFLLIARLLRDKGVLEYVEAARRVKERHPTARFQLLGETDAVNRTAIDRATVDSWSAEGATEYLGKTEDVRPFIEAADCVVLPSYREGTPRTLLEAAAMARPLVATDVPGCREVVEDERTGLLCRVKDAEDLARAMTRVIEMGRGPRAAMGAAGRAKMEREFGQSRVIDIYRGLVAEIAGRRT